MAQVLTSCSLASFSLVDAYQSLCGRTVEILPHHFLARLAGLPKPCPGVHHTSHHLPDTPVSAQSVHRAALHEGPELEACHETTPIPRLSKAAHSQVLKKHAQGMAGQTACAWPGTG